MTSFSHERIARNGSPELYLQQEAQIELHIMNEEETIYNLQSRNLSISDEQM
jgi:hypothetical protein